MSNWQNLEFGLAQAARERQSARNVRRDAATGVLPGADRRQGGARNPLDVLNTDDPVSWAARFGSEPVERLLCPRGCLLGREHVHDRTGAAHPVTPDGRWAITRPDPPAAAGSHDTTEG